MGLLDVINGMQNGPRGQPGPTTNVGSRGMSPITMAILGLLAYKAIGHLGRGPASPGSPPTTEVPGGRLGDLLKGGLDGLLGGPASGNILSGGLNDLLKQFQQGGLTDVVDSWVGIGPNKQISPDAMSKVLTEDQIKILTEQTGMSREELIAALSQYLPKVVDHLTPHGRLPTEQEAPRIV